MNGREGENLPFKLLAVLHDYNEILQELLELLVLEHADCLNKSNGPNIALADILKKADLSSFKVLSYQVTLEKFYDVSVIPYKIRDSIDIKSLDLTPIVDILKFIEGFPTYVKNNVRCSQPNHEKCCKDCNHNCVICSNPQCGKKCSGKNHDHGCMKCQEKKTVCDKFKTVCCKKCQKCLKCGRSESEDKQCSTLKLKFALDFVHFLRNTFCHISPSDCADFMAGLITLKTFPSSTNWDELSQEILKAADHILSYMCDVLPNPITKDRKTDLHNQVLKSCELEKNLSQCMKKIERSFKVLGKDVRSIKDDLVKQFKKLQADVTEVKEVVEEVKEDVKDLPKMNENVTEIKNDVKFIKKTIQLQETQKLTANQEAIEKASKSLKDKYIERFGEVPKNPAIDRNRLSETVPREKLIVDIILESEKQLEGSNYVISEIDSHQLFDMKKKYVVMTGDPGIGKTTFIETLLYRWAKGEIWNGNNKDVPFFKFVFVLRCRDLTKYRQNKKLSLDYLLKNQYRDVFQKPVTTDELICRKNEVLLIIEGFDEFIGFNEFKTASPQMSVLCQCLYDILDPKGTCHYYRLITSRPIGSRELFKKFKSTSNKISQVTLKGFSDEGIRKYIFSHFGGDSENAKLVEKKLEEGRLFTLATRPFFCWAYCSLIEDSMEMALPETFSEIFSSIILIFMRNHGEKATSSLSEFVSSKTVKSAIFKLAEIAYVTCREEKAIFSKEDLPSQAKINLDNLSRSSLIGRVDGDELDVPRYQFFHLTFQEFLAAFHIFLNSMYDSINAVSEKHSIILLFLSGFLGNKERKKDSSQQVIKLLSQLKEEKGVPVIELKGLMGKAATIIEQRDELYSAMIFEFQDRLDKLPPIKMITVPSTQHLLSSYDIICIRHLFKAINDENQPSCEFPFKELTLSLKHAPEEIIQLFRPYLSHLNKLSLPTFDDKYIDDLALCIPNLHTVELPHCGLDKNHWKRIFESIKSDRNRQLKCFFIRDSMEYFLKGYLWYVEHNQLIERSSYENLHIFEKAGVGVNVARIKLLIGSIKSNIKTLRLQFLSLKIRDISTFEMLSNNIVYFRSIKRMNILLSLTCDHQKEKEQRIRKGKFKDKISIISTKVNIFQEMSMNSIIVCKKCRNKFRKYFNKIKAVYQVELPMLISHNIMSGDAEFYWQIILYS